MKPGQTLVEVLIVFSILVVGLLALVQVAIRSAANSGFARRQTVATGYANTALEFVRQQKETLGWDAFRTAFLGNKCFNGSTVYTCGSCPATFATEYSGCVVITDESVTPPQSIRVEAQVSWQDAGKTYTTRQRTVFTRY